MILSKMKAKIVKVVIDQGHEGLFYATSPDLKGLLVAEPTFEGALAAVPKAIADMFLACDAPVIVSELESDNGQSWVAVPASARNHSPAMA